jgi:Protein of unknown function (DUF4230)
MSGRFRNTADDTDGLTGDVTGDTGRDTARYDTTERPPRAGWPGSRGPRGPRRERRGGTLLGRLGGVVVAIAAVMVLALVLSAVHLLPQLRNPFAETTTDRSQPVLLKSITQLSRYEAASGSFEVVVDLQNRSFMPSFIEGSETLFVGQGSDIAYVDFAQLKGQAIHVSADRTAVTITLPRAQLEPAVLDVRHSYVFAQQQGLANRIGSFFSGNPNNQQQVYVTAQQKIQTAAKQSPLLTEAQKNTQSMLTGMLRSLGFQQVTVDFG